VARSPAVWIVLSASDPAVPLAAFTVKHELCTWLRKNHSPQSVSHLNGWKVSDGPFAVSGGKHHGPWPLDLLALRELGE
jgi:hypothetical protein